MSKYLLSFPSAAVVAPDSEWEAVGRPAPGRSDPGAGGATTAGRIVFRGAPADLVAAQSTLTGQHLALYVSA